MTKKKGTGPDDVGASLDELVSLTAGASGPAGSSATPSGATTAGPAVEVRLDLADDGGPPFAPDDVYDAGGWADDDAPPLDDGRDRRDDEARANRERRERARAGGDEATARPAGVMLADALPRAVETLEARAYKRERPVPLFLFPWGAVSWQDRQQWTVAEEMLGGGLWPGLWMLVGATGTGKTQLALALSLGAALEGCPVAYVGLELDNVGIVARLLGLLSRRPWSELYLGKPAHTGGPLIEVEAVRTAAGRLEDLPILLVEGGPMGWAPDRLADVGRQLADLAAARGIDTKQRPPLVVLDFLQLVGDPDDAKALPVRERIQRASYQARELARSLGVVVIAVSSTSRENAKNLRIEDGALPWPSELVGTGKESGEIEYSADGVLVMCGHAGEIGDEGGDKAPALVSLAVAKLRAGKVGWLHLEFNGHAHRPASDGRIAALEAAREAAETSPGALLVAGKADDAKARIAKCDDPDVLLEAMRAEDRRRTPRSTVKDAIRGRLAELTGAADDDGAKGGSGTKAGGSKAGKGGGSSVADAVRKGGSL